MSVVPSRTAAAVALACTAVIVDAGAAGAVARRSTPPGVIWVSPDGDDSGNGTRTEPLRTVQAAIDRAGPGTVVEVGTGTYPEALTTRSAGADEAPIVLRGHDAMLAGDPERSGRILQVRHDHWVVERFAVSGQDVGIWIEGARDVVVRSNEIHQFRGECVRVKYLSSDVLVERNAIHDCGREDFVESPGSGKNGEGVYIGTAPEQLDRNPTAVSDQTTRVLVRDNVIATRGNECVDIKEGATANIVEFNDCTDQRDAESGGFDARGSGNVFRYNRSWGNDGAGIRLGGDTEADGIENDVIGNELADNSGAGIKVMRRQQGRVCGNDISGSDDAISDDEVENPSCEANLPEPGARYGTPGRVRRSRP
jgi:hypothetical protein